MAYSPYDSPYDNTYSRPRRQSLGYRATTPVNYPYDRLGATYSEPMLHGEYYDRPSYPMYSSTPNRSVHYLPSLYDDADYMDTGVYPPVVQPLGMGRPRRSSSRSYSPIPPSFSDPFRRHSGIVKFKRKGAFRGGLTLGEAQANVRLAGWDSYSFNDLGVDHRGKIYVKIAWPGYSPLNYEIPVDGYGGRIDLQSLARRIGRAVAHYLQANVIPIPWDRIELQHMEEVSMGTWLLKMNTN
ncbi:uncharacterized protein EDB91DRAFT_1242651 [Suillus paluster]|uniref:uncharacterized protein n=1 Tax=Suillus paluster TaxID=48578 RepID=UPI001B86E797|nr:uncharacterized protein EDB91DRAFT_1242651 [Suillus paluster]KAG1753676.1 hypothetical protein EDB91DRAFT_1242651 [Suillus paluster]